MGPEAADEASEGFAGAKASISCRAMRDLFAADAVLLIGEGEHHTGDTSDVLVVQGERSGGVVATVDGEGDIADAVGPGAATFSGLAVFAGAHEPEEGDHEEVGDGVLSFTMDGVFEVEDFKDLFDDFGVDRVHSIGRIVLVAEPAEEVAEE